MQRRRRGVRPRWPPRCPAHARAGCSRAHERTPPRARVREPSRALADDNASRLVPVSAVIFDFNGTLSHDEPILCEIFGELFAAEGRPLSAQEYFDELAGLSDPEIVRTWLGRDHPAVEEVIQRRIERYRELGADGSSVPEDVSDGKPHPAGYLRALELLDGELDPPDVLVFEDTEAGVASAKAAGLRCFGVLGTLAPARLAAADEVVPAIDVELMRRVLR